MRDAWLAGMVAMESATRTSAPGSNTDKSAAGDEASATAADLLTADLALPVGRAMMITANRSVSYWLNLAKIVASHQARSVRALTAEAGEAGGRSRQLAVTDELRAVLREVGDLSTREARILQHELEALGESLAQRLQQPDPSAAHRRRCRAKL